MKTVKALILERADMVESEVGKDVLLIQYDDFKMMTNDKILESDIALFVDQNGRTKVLKNRFGDDGNGVFIGIIEDMKQNSIDNSLGYGEQYFDDIISLLSKNKK